MHWLAMLVVLAVASTTACAAGDAPTTGSSVTPTREVASAVAGGRTTVLTGAAPAERKSGTIKVAAAADLRTALTLIQPDIERQCETKLAFVFGSSGQLTTQVAAGAEHTVALRTTGAITCWGNNNYSQCNVPTDLGEVVQIAAGSVETIALKANGQVRCWGAIWDVPADLTDAVQVAEGGTGFTIARRSNGQVRCWGSNDFHACDTPADLTDVVQVAGGAYQAQARGI